MVAIMTHEYYNFILAPLFVLFVITMVMTHAVLYVKALPTSATISKPLKVTKKNLNK
jgi:hypothetical protein